MFLALLIRSRRDRIMFYNDDADDDADADDDDDDDDRTVTFVKLREAADSEALTLDCVFLIH